jgi:general secretion pathway protein D
MRDATTSTKQKVPILGDIPVIGFLFRSSTFNKTKTNLLLVLTPYVIRDQNDLRTVFERKMQERQEFLDRYFVFSDQTPYEPPKDYTRLNGLLEDIRQSYIDVDERRRLAESTKPRERKMHEPGQPLSMPDIIRPAGAGGDATAAAGGPANPPAHNPGAEPAQVHVPGRNGPTVLTPGSRNVPPPAPSPSPAPPANGGGGAPPPQ